jgi:hypothetical protein
VRADGSRPGCGARNGATSPTSVAVNGFQLDWTDPVLPGEGARAFRFFGTRQRALITNKWLRCRYGAQLGKSNYPRGAGVSARVNRLSPPFPEKDLANIYSADRKLLSGGCASPKGRA